MAAVTEADRRAAEIDAAWGERERGLVAPRRWAMRRRLAGEQNWRCCYCGCRTEIDTLGPRAATIEHLTPKIDGGSDDYENLVSACSRCNNDRGHAPLDEWLAIVTAWKRADARRA